MAARDEGDVELGSFLKAVARNWWVVVALALIGLLAGALLTLLTPKTYDSTASVYIGQTTDANGNPMPGLNSNARAAVQLVTSEAVLQETVKRVGEGLTVSGLRGSISVDTPTQVVKGSTTAVNFVTITVSDTKRARAAAAANALAAILIERIGSGTGDKITLLQGQIDTNNSELTALNRRSADAETALKAIGESSASKSDKALASVPYVSIVQSAATERESISSDLQRDQLMLLVAKDVELARVLHEAVPADSASAPSLTLNGGAGILAGVVVGLVLALFRERLRRPRPAVA
jgi:capsular polysaccharide biosynthesis protein